jgi:YHS domain-containing protein
VQDVPALARRRGLSFKDYLDERWTAVLDDAHCVRLNWEAYFFAEKGTRERFLADPLAYCGLLTDPVSRRRFRPRRDAPSAVFAGVTYYFESDEQRARFAATPESFRLPGWRM